MWLVGDGDMVAAGWASQNLIPSCAVPACVLGDSLSWVGYRDIKPHWKVNRNGQFH